MTDQTKPEPVTRSCDCGGHPAHPAMRAHRTATDLETMAAEVDAARRSEEHRAPLYRTLEHRGVIGQLETGELVCSAWDIGADGVATGDLVRYTRQVRDMGGIVAGKVITVPAADVLETAPAFMVMS